MRFVKRNTYRRGEEDLSAASSVQSVDSNYEIFSACSDFSEGDCIAPEEVKWKRCRHHFSTPSGSSTHSMSYGSAMDRRETSTLLIANDTAIDYRSIPSDSSSDTLGIADFPSKEYLNYKPTEKPNKTESNKQNSLITIFSVWNTIMGSSLLTMAWGVERAGLPAALVLMAVMAALCLYTAHVLLNVNKHHGSSTCEVPALCRLLLGRWAERLAHCFSLLVLTGANVVYWILITNFLYFTVNYFRDLSASNGTVYNTSLLCPKHDGINGSLIMAAPTADSSYWGLHSTVPIYVAVIVFPIMNFKDVSFFTKFNSLGTLSVVYLLVFVVVKGWAWGINIGAALEEVRPTRDAAVLSGMLALSFYIHNIIITIMSNNKQQENNGRDLTIAFFLVTVTYGLVGAVFYICFPLAKSCIEDNILNNFEMHDVMTAVARMLLLFQVITVYPLVAYMLRSEALLLACESNEHKEPSARRVLLVNGSIVLLCVLVACFCPSIGTIIRYTGAVSGLVHVFALPSLLQVRSLQLRGRLNFWNGALYACIVAFGAINLLMQFFITE